MSSTVLLIILAQYKNSIHPYLTQKQVCNQFGETLRSNLALVALCTFTEVVLRRFERKTLWM